LAILTAVLGLAKQTQAGVIFSNDFSGVSNPNDAGYYSWQPSGTPYNTMVSDSNSPLSGKVLNNPGTTSANATAIKQWSGTTLTTSGDFISLSVDFRGASTTAGSFTLGLLNNMPAVTSDIIGSASPYAAANGYYSALNFDVSNSAKYRQVTNGVTTLIDSPLGTVVALGDNLGHRVVYTLTRVDTGIQMDVSVDGSSRSSFVDTTPVSYTFNSVSIADYVAAKPTHFDNIMLSSNTIPEPTTSGLFLITGAGMILIRHAVARRNKREILPAS
jgi:hypothetical protein